MLNSIFFDESQKMVPHVFLALVLCLIFSSTSPADIIAPASLNAGDKFRIVFVTSTSRNAASSNIADYDAFVTARAVAASLDSYNGNLVTWQAIASTSSVSAISRLPLTSSALFLIDGTKVADSGSDLWDGSVDHAISRDELGNLHGFFVWTGTSSSGTAFNPLGGGGGGAQTGSSSAANSQWIQNSFRGLGDQFPLYAVSSELTVSAAVPEPSSLAMLSVGAIGFIKYRRRRRKVAPMPD